MVHCLFAYNDKEEFISFINIKLYIYNHIYAPIDIERQHYEEDE